jgi:16S rRNA (guanine527-N7)-methyltransferase
MYHFKKDTPMDKPLFLQNLVHGLEFFHLPTDECSLDRYFQYYLLLSDWNTRMNLVSERDMGRFVEYHILDSLKILSCADFPGTSNILDFGSGAGLPGIPLAIALPHCRVTLLDSILKRTRFLETVASSIPLPNVSVVRSRIEELPSSLNGSFDAVVTRATVSLSSFFTSCSRFISPRGFLVSIKGEQVSEELLELENVKKSPVFHIRDCMPVVPEYVRSGHVVIISHA